MIKFKIFVAETLRLIPQFFLLLNVFVFRCKHMFVLFGCPNHTNLGDQAQSYCIKKWLSDNYEDYCVFSVSIPSYTIVFRLFMRFFLRKDDRIVFHSGYHLTDHFHEQDVYCDIVRNYKSHEILIFPQTIKYENEENFKNVVELFNSHRKILLLCRDNISFQSAKDSFVNIETCLFPDIVTSLIGAKIFNNNRDGILFCIRDDIESFYDKNDISDLASKFSGICKCDFTDTTSELSLNEVKSNIENILNIEFDKYSKYSLVITDRYHGTIFSLISSTPVIVLKTTDHKLISGVSWFSQEEYADYIYLAEDLEDAFDKAIDFLKIQNRTKLSPFFKREYYDGLALKVQKSLGWK